MSVPRRLVAVARQHTNSFFPATVARARPATLTTAPIISTRRQSTQASRKLHQQAPRKAQFAAAAQQEQDVSVESSNPALSFPCLDAIEVRTASLSQRSLAGPEPSYTTGAHLTFHSKQPILLDWGGILSEFKVAYETWGALNESKSNAVLLHTGLSASSHAHSTEANPKDGWWEKFIGPGLPLDTNKYFVICTNVIGGCYGSTGPSSLDPANGEPYATRFPILTMEDMVRAQFGLLDHLGIERLYASVGSSMGGMQSLAAGVLFPERVGRIVSISGCARSHPYSIAMRHTQRQVLMADAHWNRGFYYDKTPPHHGMKLAREIATITYRSGPEWERRFGRVRADPSRPPALCPDFRIETYLDHAGEKWCLEYDPNSLLYVSKAMDLFDLGQEHRNRINKVRQENSGKFQAIVDGRAHVATSDSGDVCNLILPDKPYEEKEVPAEPVANEREHPKASAHDASPDLVAGLSPLANTPVLVLGVQSDILFPAFQQQEIADSLNGTGNRNVTHIELGLDKSEYGHDTFLLDLKNIGGPVQTFLG
ncbi:homoserine O-acetyltransferas-like protein [Lophiotrema nucula]|uniref:Homoserine O-acetyltransferas-like protein n=1 Tax=Lophiotrema nucula TaxID=690887 RepID=A0A6A5Z0V0_9PLEO|nr:homoserine O-acetyltransferas-like protein [Lophiotrema nucula]